MGLRDDMREEDPMTERNPVDTLTQIASGYVLPRSLHVIADLGVADALDEIPRTATDLAASVGADPGALRRVLRLLAAHGVFEMRDWDDSFCHSPALRLLRTDHPYSMRAFAQMFGLPINWAIFQELAYSVRTGRPATEQVLPDGLWTYYPQHPEAGRIFNAAMEAKAHAQVAGIIAAYDFSGFAQVGDIGGGRGHLIRAVLDSVPTAKGVLFDLPHVIAEVGDMAADRLTLQPGDFFHDALPACDAYLLMEIIHDWGDEEATAILRAVRRAAPVHAKLLLIETIIPDEPGPDWSKVLDIAMLALLGGRQRMRQEYEILLDAAGFRLQREINTHADISILEATTA